MQIRVLMLTAVLVASFITTGLAAPAGPATKPVLEQASVAVSATGENVYKVSQTITIANPDKIAKGIVENTLAKIQGSRVSELTVTVNGAKIDPKLTEGNYLTKIAFPLPAGVTGNFTYDISYFVNIQPGEFAVPLVVPMYASMGKNEVVKAEFTAPAGTYIHEDSFPILKKVPADNKVTTTMANIPSRFTYVYGKQMSSIFNLYNLISSVVFLLLMLIIVKWFLAERGKEQVGMHKQGGEA